jgi:lysophospholipase L1-like esterase
MGQRDSAPALIARQAHVSLPQPLMSRPGVPPPFVIVDRNHNGALDPGEVKRRSNGIGFRSQPNKEAHNLAVPGERVATVTDKIDPRNVISDAIDGNVKGRDVMKLLILDLPIQDEPVSQISRARDLSPSFLLVWLGANDVLGMAERTNPNAVQSTQAEFGMQYRGLLDALADTGAPMVVANIPDVTRIPVLRRAAGEVTTCRADDGTSRPVADGDLLSIQLDRSLLPEPPCNRVLDSAEQAFVRGTVMAFNSEIAAAAVETEQRRGVPIATVDAFALFDQFADHGVDVRGDGSLVLTTRYLGGLFTLDGVHPTRTTHAIIANAFIDAINTRFGAGLTKVDVAAVAARDGFVGNRFQPSGEPPFGLIGKDEGAVDEALDHIADKIDDLINDIEHTFKDFF